MTSIVYAGRNARYLRNIYLITMLWIYYTMNMNMNILLVYILYSYYVCDVMNI